MRLLLAAVTAMALLSPALGEDDSYLHAQGHNSYRDWASKKTGNCCNNQDCRWLADAEWREDPVTEVKIDGEWCPVKPEHLLVKGKSPDATKAHACIDRRTVKLPACERLLCFTGVPKT